MSDEQQPKTPGLFECYAARANADLTAQQIHHDELVAWDDEDALSRFRAKTGGLFDVFDVRRIMDVRI